MTAPHIPVSTTAPVGSGTATPRRVLVVDDNEDIVMTMRLLLTKLGHTVRVAYNGQQAMTEAEAFRPDVVLMDIGLPVMDGYEAARRLRQQPWGRGIKLVAITGWGQARDVALALEAGFDHHVVKPVDRKLLESLLEA